MTKNYDSEKNLKISILRISDDLRASPRPFSDISARSCAKQMIRPAGVKRRPLCFCLLRGDALCLVVSLQAWLFWILALPRQNLARDIEDLFGLGKVCFDIQWFPWIANHAINNKRRGWHQDSMVIQCWEHFDNGSSAQRKTGSRKAIKYQEQTQWHI